MQETDVCKNCGRSPVERGYQVPLCPPCRTLLCKRPLPAWIYGVSVVVALALLFALARFPASVKAGIAFERGRRAERAGNYRSAMAEYRSEERRVGKEW